MGICSLVFVLPAAAAPLQHTSSKQNRARSINHLGAIVTVLELMGGAPREIKIASVCKDTSNHPRDKLGDER